MPISEKLNQIAQNISAARQRRHEVFERCLHDIKLVAVTKNHGVEAIREAVDAGATAIGENRVQEAISKLPVLDRQVEWHLIGHLQTNKVRQAIPFCTLIHSVDSERLAQEIDRVAGKLQKRQDILLQVNVAAEATKFGIEPAAVMTLANDVSQMEHVNLCGLMTIAPHYTDLEQTRPVFRRLYELFMELKAAKLPNMQPQWLSMGMTNDYVIAIEEGANLIRIGTGIFGTRQY